MFGVILIFGSLMSVLWASGNGGQISDDILEKRFQEMDVRLNKLEKRNEEIETRFTSLQHDYIEVKSQNENLEKENAEMRKMLTALKKENAFLENEFLKIQNKSFPKRENIRNERRKPFNIQQNGMTETNILHALQSRNETLYSGKQAQENPTTQESEDKTTNKGKRLLIPGTSSPTTTVLPTHARVAFHSRLTEKLTNPGDNQHIEFKGVTTNVGNGYNGDTGTFTCPVAGTYVFSVTILSMPDKRINTEIVRDGQSLVYTYSYNDNYYNSASALVVVDLQEHDTVWVRVQGSLHHTGDVMDSWSYFSGFILWPNH